DVSADRPDASSSPLHAGCATTAVSAARVIADRQTIRRWPSGQFLVTNTIDDSVTVHVLPHAPGEKRRAGIRLRILVVAIGRARSTVAVLVVRAAVDPIAVLVDTVAHDVLRLR